jgi:hypothetical protein
MGDSSDDDVFGLCGGYPSRPPTEPASSLISSTCVPSKTYSPIRCLSSPANSRRLVRQSRLREHHNLHSSDAPQRSQSSGREDTCRTPHSRSSSSSPGSGRFRSSPIPISPLASGHANSRDPGPSSPRSSPRAVPAFLKFGPRNLDSLYAAPSRSESLQELFSQSPNTLRRNILIDMFSWGKNRCVQRHSYTQPRRFPSVLRLTLAV